MFNDILAYRILPTQFLVKTQKKRILFSLSHSKFSLPTVDPIVNIILNRIVFKNKRFKGNLILHFLKTYLKLFTVLIKYKKFYRYNSSLNKFIFLPDFTSLKHKRRYAIKKKKRGYRGLRIVHLLFVYLMQRAVVTSGVSVLYSNNRKTSKVSTIFNTFYSTLKAYGQFCIVNT